jgi:acetyltransferase-like isoleucine patch superfamily enzyme
MKIKDCLLEIWWKVRWSSRATSLLHVFAMWAPFNSWRIFFYRLRGTKIGKNVYIVQGSFLEESRPWLIEIQDNATIGANVTIATHDAVYNKINYEFPIRYGKVVVKKNAVICPCSTIMPGVTIGESAIVTPASLVYQNVPDGIIVGGNPAKIIMKVQEGIEKKRKHFPEYLRDDVATKYPWKIDTDKIQLDV